VSRLTRLAIKYRPKDFETLVGQESLVRELKGILKQKTYKTLNSIVLSGGSGSGKTTTARIMAKAFNCLSKKDNKPCNKCKHCEALDENKYPDYLELDATSYKGAKDIEPLKQLASQYPSVKGGIRIIYLDEAHVISNLASDILLKLLEDGKNSTIWIFATTQLHSMRPALVNRSLSLKIKNSKQVDMVKELERICKLEGIKVREGFLEKIVRVNRIGLRDAVSGLDKFYSAYGKDLREVEDIDLQSKEDLLLDIFLQIKEEGLVSSTIALEDVEIEEREYERVLTNILIGLSILEMDSLHDNLSELGINESKLKKLGKTLGGNTKTLVEHSIGFNIQTLDHMKMYLVFIQKLLQKEDSIIKQLEVDKKEEEDAHSHKRRGIKLGVDKTIKEEKKPKKVEKKKPKKKKKVKKKKIEELEDYGFSEEEPPF
jgi:DNA polymerase-3 subunit gamma/tau